MVKGHKIKEEIEIAIFTDIISNIKEEDINTTKHTDFRLNEAQRKVFKDRVIKEFIKGQKPVLVGIQYNNCYAVFYSYDKSQALKVILDIQGNKCEIVTFYIIDKDKIPRI